MLRFISTHLIPSLHSVVDSGLSGLRPPEYPGITDRGSIEPCSGHGVFGVLRSRETCSSLKEGQGTAIQAGCRI